MVTIPLSILYNSNLAVVIIQGVFLRLAVSPNAWSMTEKNNVMTNTRQNKILRKVYGPVTGQGF
jgi:hypothetical protein